MVTTTGAYGENPSRVQREPEYLSCPNSIDATVDSRPPTLQPYPIMPSRLELTLCRNWPDAPRRGHTLLHLRSSRTTRMPLFGLPFGLLEPTTNGPRQTELSCMGAQMGAQIKLDLTSDVTHLIVGNTNSAKYRYVAKAREDVKVLLPEWVHAVQEVWMAGEDVKVPELEERWRLPTFYGLKICLTGFDDRMIYICSEGFMLINNSGTTEVYPRYGHEQRRRVPRRFDEISHASHRGQTIWEQIRACLELAHEDCHMGMV